MNFDKAVKSLQEKFKSGNDIPVTRAAITREEFEAIENHWKLLLGLQNNNTGTLR